MSDQVEEQHRQKAMIENAVNGMSLTIQDWGEDEDGVRAELGRWYALDDGPQEMFFSGDEGVLIASVVGAQKYGNERVYFGFMADGTDVPQEVRYPLDILERVES